MRSNCRIQTLDKATHIQTQLAVGHKSEEQDDTQAAVLDLPQLCNTSSHKQNSRATTACQIGQPCKAASAVSQPILASISWLAASLTLPLYSGQLRKQSFKSTSNFAQASASVNH